MTISPTDPRLAGAHVTARTGGLVAAIVGVLTGPGCYTGADGIGPDAQGPHAANGEEGADDDGDDGDDDGANQANDECDAATLGPSALRRLTRSQYNNTVRDLLGVTDNPAEKLSPDERIGPFFNNGTAPVGELVVEQYMRVAEAIAESAMADLDSLVPCDADAAPLECGDDFVDAFGLRAFRRPITADERAVLTGLFETGSQSGGGAEGLRLVVQAVLQSPQFLYHLELAEPDPGESLVALDGYELASKISYFLWDSMPDDALFAAAQTDELATEEQLRAQAERMLDDPRAADAIASFHRQWLHLGELPILEKSATEYADFNAAMRDAMVAETTRFADWVIRSDDGRLETLLTASYSFVEAPLFDLYGVAPGPDHDPTMPVELDPNQRAGILTHAGVLATHAHANQSSPIRRGKLVREEFLCTPLAAPPPEADLTTPPLDPDLTTRERFNQHRADPSCAACHELIDPIGFGFEHYDGIGAWRDTEGVLPVDATGEVVGLADSDGTFDGAPELAKLLASSPEVRSCVAKQWFNFGVGRIPGPADACSFGTLAEAFEASDYNIRELLITMVTTDAFRYRQLQEES